MQLSLPDDQPLLSAEPPADQELFGLAPDPASDPPDGPDAWLSDLTEPERDAYLAATQLLSQQRVFAAGFLPRDVGVGAGFAAGGVLDRLPAGPVLGQFAADAWAQGLAGATDEELIRVLTAWRRLTSWASAGEAAAVTELTERRRSQGPAGGDPDLMEYLPDELAAALTLTKRAAGGVLDFACGLARLPRTGAALARGDIDRPKALVLVNETCGVSDKLAAAVEEQVIVAAPTQTTGQLLAADQRIDALARQLKADGAIGSLPQLRARLYRPAAWRIREVAAPRRVVSPLGPAAVARPSRLGESDHATVQPAGHGRGTRGGARFRAAGRQRVPHARCRTGLAAR
jgi:hypothetical protein